jgi:hypothetical protein
MLVRSWQQLAGSGLELTYSILIQLGKVSLASSIPPYAISKHATPARIFHALLQAHWPESRIEYACWRHTVLSLLLPGLVYISVVDVRLPTGGSPVATSFLCFAKETEAKKGDAKSLPCGCPIMQDVKWEMKQTRCAQTASLLIHFPPRTIGSATCEFDSKAKSKARSKANAVRRNRAQLALSIAPYEIS